MHALARRLIQLLLACACLGIVATVAQATPRALLVGVSELANQPSSMWLAAPRNDVILMRQALQQRGFAPADITVLADGVNGAGLPESQQIRDALGRLLAQSRSGDFVLLYFSGHGTRVRDRAKRYQEPDGLAENFLARDARLAPGAAGMPLAGGLRDVDFDGWIQAFLARDVAVWSVFDTCSAASMTRGIGRGAAAAPEAGEADDEVRFRGVPAEALAGGGSAEPGPDMRAPPSPAVPRARYVAFFASESHQVTPELKLPRRDRAARPQGLLTWAIAESMARQPGSYRELFNDVVSLYPPVIAELETRFPQRELPSPVAEGNLDTPLFGNTPQPLSSRPAWPARRSGAQLALNVGQLDGLEPQQEVRVNATQADGSVLSALVRLDEVELGSARLAVPAALARSDDAVAWTVVPGADPAAAQLRVQAGPEGLPAGMSLAYPASIRLLRAGGGEADVRIAPRGAGEPASLQVLSPALAALLGPGDGAPGAPLRLPPPEGAAGLRAQLSALAQLKWLAQLNALAQGGRLDGFEASVEVWNGERLVRSAPAAQAAAERQPPLAEGERALLAVRNTSGQSVDLVVIGVDAAGGIRQVYPQALSETNRFERGTREAPASQRFELPWLASGARGGRLLVVAAPATPLSGPRLFGAAPPGGGLPELRVRGALAPERARQVYSALVGWGA